MKIGLVSPYVYPLPGGVTQHVRYLYENLRLRGHDVRILTSSHGLQRASEGDIIRIGKGFSLPVNGSVGTITLSPRFVSQVLATLERCAQPRVLRLKVLQPLHLLGLLSHAGPDIGVHRRGSPHRRLPAERRGGGPGGAGAWSAGVRATTTSSKCDFTTRPELRRICSIVGSFCN